ncbi:hypothetical protein KCTC32516_01248 [Polaribacter huanghezhanensis]|uniref:zinc-dependent metalloprotease n=1 Tax=Polaribacter huanghezhanensis TaxID=1354726 RepID=UPI002648F791|nr:zinc-dependent metalloprotease family protein [Polaribacter huanghezhanensis]WKD85900.1 hypothetical protein KCTC32516_01248 [Polaribacter huanghezhanensis]
MMKKYYKLSFLFFFFLSISMFSQNIWTKKKAKARSTKKALEYRESQPTSYELYTLDADLVDKKLTLSTGQETIMELPTPNGIQRFLVKEASVFSDELAAKFPLIKSYVGVGVDDATARVRFSKSRDGFHAIISSGNYPMFLIDPYTKDKKTAIAYFKNKSTKSKFQCLFEKNTSKGNQRNFQKTTNANDGKLRTYRLAVVATAEFSQFHLTNQNIAPAATDAVKKAAVLSAINTIMTRVNWVFERDLGVTMKLVTNNENLIFLDSATDGLTNDNINTLLEESQKKCDTIIGDANYDIGHLFAWVNDESGNGLAAGSVVCESGTKAKGVTMKKTPLGDGFAIDLVAHEIGHQFGANHTQNNADCNINRGTAVEPGSGSTIMAYAGFCAPNIQFYSDAYFHAASIKEMWTYVSTIATCATETATNNSAPVANAGTNFFIPKSTPFVLKGAATDVDSANSLTYNWEQEDNEAATIPPAATSTVGPMFRSLPSSTSPDRYMPKIATVLAGNTSSTWEVVPSVTRSMNFSLTVRDNVLNGGATARDDTKITVDGNSGPFRMTSQNDNTVPIEWKGASIQTITWDAANTTFSPVNCAYVSIVFSTDNGVTFDTVIEKKTPNDGVQDVIVPNLNTTNGRIMVKAFDNVFYAVNSAKITTVKVVVKDGFLLYPNPTINKELLLSLKKETSKSVEVKLFNLFGQLIQKDTYNNPEKQFLNKMDYSNVSQGLYILVVTNGSIKFIRKVFIK